MFEERLNELTEGLDLNGWQISLSGVRKGEGKSPSPIPIVPVSILENLDDGIEKVELTFFKSGRWKTIVVERNTIANKNKIVGLANDGLEVNTDNASELVKYLADIISHNLDTLPRHDAKSVLGWQGDYFLPYTGDIRFDGEDAYKSLRQSVCEKGDYFKWVDHTEQLRKKLEMRLFMDASFASPLIEKIGENNTICHLFGQSGCGKSVALLVAMSIWGDPSFGKLTRTLNMTKNSMLGTAAFLQNIPFAGDELQTIKTKWHENFDEIVMCLTEGIDRGRMWGTTILPTRSWKCSFLFTGEEPIIKSSSGGGAKNRVIEIECMGKVAEEGNKTANLVKANYGHAGKIYINKLVELGANELHRRYDVWLNKILEEVDTTDKQAGAMALFLTADDIAREIFYPSEQPLTVSKVRHYLSSESEVDVTKRAFSFIKALISENARNFEDDAYNRWGVIEGDDCYINKSVLSRELESKGFDFEACKNKWKEYGYLVMGSDGRMRINKRIKGVVTQCIRLNLADKEAEPNLELPFYEF